MTKKEFMQKLKDSLIGLNQTDKREVLLDYEEHFIDGRNQGRTEEDICAALGDPSQIAKEIRNQSTPNNDGVNTAGYIVGIILLGIACIALASLLFSFVTGAVGGIFGIVAVSAVLSNTLLKVLAISAVVFVITICALLAMGIIKLIPLVVKWFRQLGYSLEGSMEKAKAVEHKRIKIHPIVWILVSVLCIASVGGMIFGSIGFTKEMVREIDAEDIYEVRDFVKELVGNNRGWVYYSDDGLEDFEEAMEEFAERMEDKYDHFDGKRDGFFAWRFIFDDD